MSIFGTPQEDCAHREEIFKAWHEHHKLCCEDCIVEVEDGSMESACPEYHLIRLLYMATDFTKGIKQ
jgi:hypothetical protein